MASSFQNWTPFHNYQDYFDYVAIVTAKSENQNYNQIESIQLSIFQCNKMDFVADYTFNKALHSDGQYTFTNFKELLAKVDYLIYHQIVLQQSSFIFCIYGKDLLLRQIPLLASQNQISPQSYFLQFIDLRQELFNFMLTNYPDVYEKLENSYDQLMPMMLSKLQIEQNNQFQNAHNYSKLIVLRLLQDKHSFNIPIIINPSNIYGQKYYLRDSWFDALPQVEQIKMKQENINLYVRVRGIPYNYINTDLLAYFTKIQLISLSDIQVKYQHNGQSTGEAIIQLHSQRDLDTMITYHRAQMDKRYIEIMSSTFDEFSDASTSQPNKEDNSLGDFELAFCGILKLRGLPWSCSEKDVKQFLENNSKIKSIKFLQDSKGKSKGECFVILKSSEVADKLKQKFHKKVLGTRYIEVFVCNPKEYLTATKRKRSRSRSRSNG